MRTLTHQVYQNFMTIRT